MGTIASNNITTRAGSGTVSISHASLSGGTTLSLSNIGTIKLSFDMEEQSEDSTNILFLPEEFTFSAFDKLSDGSSLFETIDALSSTDEITVEFSFTTDGGLSWTDDHISFTKNDMKYKKQKREVEFNCRYILSFVTEIADMFVARSEDVYDYDLDDDGTAEADCMPVKFFIENVFSDLFPGTTDIVETTSFNDDPLVDSNDTWVIFKDNNTSDYDQVTSVLDAMYRIAACDGSVVGTVMGYNFMINRLSTSRDTTLNEDDVSTLTIEPSLQNYNNLGCWFYGIGGYSGAWSAHDTLYGDSDGLNNKATKSLNVQFLMREINPVSYTSVTNDFEDDSGGLNFIAEDSLSEDVNKGQTQLPVAGDPNLNENSFVTFDRDGLYLVQSSDSSKIVLKTPLRKDISTSAQTERITNSGRKSLATNACNAYAKAYGADGSRRISCTVLDIDTLKPFETFSLDSSFESFLQSKTFRPSDIEYDLKADKIKISAYQIS